MTRRQRTNSESNTRQRTLLALGVVMIVVVFGTILIIRSPAPELPVPVFVQTPSDTIALQQGQDYILAWTATDDNPTTYEIRTRTSSDGSGIESTGPWTNLTHMEYNVADFVSLEDSDYTLHVTCRIFDEDGQSSSHTAQIQVTVPSTPEITITFLGSDGPSAALEGSQVTITFRPRSYIPHKYEIYVNNELKEQPEWDGMNIEYSFVVIEGENRVLCKVWDTNGNSETDAHIVTGLPDVPEKTPDPKIPGETTPGGTVPSNEFNSPFGSATLPLLGIGASALILVALVFLMWRD